MRGKIKFCNHLRSIPPAAGLFRICLWLRFTIFIPLLALGCTHDHKIDLHPEIFVRVSNIGKGEQLTVRVRDIRSQKAISKKVSNLKLSSDRAINTVNIYASSSVRDTILDKITEGFQRMGFHTVKPGRLTNRKLEVEIYRLQLNYKSGNLGVKIPEVNAQMETILRIRAAYGNQMFKNIYSSRLIKSHRMFTGKFKNERLVNNSLSMAIQKMLDDPDLIQFLLAGRP